MQGWDELRAEFSSDESVCPVQIVHKLNIQIDIQAFKLHWIVLHLLNRSVQTLSSLTNMLLTRNICLSRNLLINSIAKSFQNAFQDSKFNFRDQLMFSELKFCLLVPLNIFMEQRIIISDSYKLYVNSQVIITRLNSNQLFN